MVERDLLKDLNDRQREAVEYIDGPSLVIAGAGSGKTRVLTYKIAYLLQQGMVPWNILALTFTNKAAREMKERIAALVGKDLAGGIWMGTFHSVFSRILRMEADKIGFSPRFTIYDQADSVNLVKTIIREMGLDDKVYKPSTVAAHISQAKNRLIGPEAYLADAKTQQYDAMAKIPRTGDIYLRYVARCRQSDVMDFDDLLYQTYLLLDEFPDVCARYGRRFEYILVDEYQDTNHVQEAILQKLKANMVLPRICLVGDDAQSIYGFRGADINNMFNFLENYACEDKARIFMGLNYRSTKTIAQAAESVIKHNTETKKKMQIERHVETLEEKGEGEPIRIYSAYSDIEEAEIVANKIAELHRREKLDYDAFAILYRTNAQSRTFEEALRKRGMPYRIYGGLSFYQRKEIKDVIAYCRLTVNPHDEEAFKRVVNYPARGIGQTTVGKIKDAASEGNTSLWNVVMTPEEYGLSVNRGTLAKLKAFAEIVGGFIAQAEKMDAAFMIQQIIRESGMMKDIFQDSSPEGMSRQENVQELLNGVQEFVAGRLEAGQDASLGEFLQEVSLLSDMDEDDGSDSRKVTLMTIHSAKGLEFPAVFIVGMEENLFPSPRSSNSPMELEEERRLFYVAITRAEQYCFLSFARSRFRYGQTEFSNPSRFLQDIDPRYVVMDQGGGFSSGMGSQVRFTEAGSRRRTSERQQRELWENHGRSDLSMRVTAKVTGLKPSLERFTSGQGTQPSSFKPGSPSVGVSGDLRVGARIEHERFGLGVIKAIEGSGENVKATVEFQNTGVKQLLLRFARFKVLE